MNLNQSSTHSQLADLLRQCDDCAGHHIVWVDVERNVHVSLLPEHISPIEFESSHPNLDFRLETLQCGNGYVGPAAAEDEHWINELYQELALIGVGDQICRLPIGDPV